MDGKPARRNAATKILGAQVALAIGALGVSIARVPPGGSGVLIPVGGSHAARWAVGHRAGLLQAGAVTGSVVIQVPSTGLQWSALRAGLLLLPAPMAGCGEPLKEG